MTLKESETFSTTGVVTWLDYYDTRFGGNWEADAALYGHDAAQQSSTTFALLDTATEDYLLGHWTFSADQRPPVYIIGKTYDVNMAASALLSMWASREMLNFDARQGDESGTRSQKYAMLLKQSSELSARRRPRLLKMIRPDVRPERHW